MEDGDAFDADTMNDWNAVWRRDSPSWTPQVQAAAM